MLFDIPAFQDHIKNRSWAELTPLLNAEIKAKKIYGNDFPGFIPKQVRARYLIYLRCKDPLRIQHLSLEQKVFLIQTHQQLPGLNYKSLQKIFRAHYQKIADLEQIKQALVSSKAIELANSSITVVESEVAPVAPRRSARNIFDQSAAPASASPTINVVDFDPEEIQQSSAEQLDQLDQLEELIPAWMLEI